MNIKPMQGRLLLKVIKDSTDDITGRGGLVLVASPDDKKDLVKAEVIKLGTQMGGDYSDVEQTVKVGDTVLFVKWAASEVTLEEETYHLIRYEDIIAVLEK